jgi:hypothetical protein
VEPMALLSISTYITCAASGIYYFILFGANAESDFNKFFRLLFALLISRFDFNSDTRPSLGSPPFETLTYSKSKRPILLLSAFESKPNTLFAVLYRLDIVTMFEEIADIALVFKPWISHLVTLLTVLLILRKYGGSHLQPW